jgi:mannose-6-phosphate isomerase-like protein (cupin superfamily)
MSETVIPSKDLEEDIDRYLRMGYRMEMIMPADAPREVLLTKSGEGVRLRSKNRQRNSNSDYATGRAGMMYRDLIPDRVGGLMVASHIKLLTDGEVPDYVHYHKIKFQMIYCLRGRIRVVYEAQGEPFWLEAGDCVVQPPEIRHRVLESQGLAEVLEITTPAVHETWVDHEICLPTLDVDPNRDFSGQRFVHHIAKDTSWTSLSDQVSQRRCLGMHTATGGLVEADVIRSAQPNELNVEPPDGHIHFVFVLNGTAQIIDASGDERTIAAGDGFVLQAASSSLSCSAGFEFLQVILNQEACSDK